VTTLHSRIFHDDYAVLFAAGAIGTLSDAELLARFVQNRGDASAEAAFATLLDRHGPMVSGVCRRVTGDLHVADDAVQAVFIVLARKAHAVRLAADDSLGRWLYGVSLRVAHRARARSKTPPGAATSLDGLDPIDPSSPFDTLEQADLRAAIDTEIARLPAHYRSAVVLCHLEGLSQKQAARRLRCPVGTVESRLNRARERLRSGLARKGLAPAIGPLALISGVTSGATVSSQTATATVAAAIRISSNAALASTVPATVAGLVKLTLRRMLMRQYLMIAGLIAFGLAITGGAVGLSSAGGGEQSTPRADEQKPAARSKVAARSERPEPPLARQLERIMTEYEDANRAFFEFFRGSTIPKENRARAAEIQPDYAALARQIVALAATAPKDPAVRDAFLWMIRKSGRGGDDGREAGEFALAATWLVRNFGDDPDAVRVGLGLDNALTAYRDHLLLSFYASAKGRESKGLARLALARYLERKASFAEEARKLEGRVTYIHDDLVRADGTLYTEKEVQSDGSYAYLLHLKQCDAGYLRGEADRLYHEVITEYGDVPFITSNDRSLEALLKQPNPRLNGKPLTEESRRKIAARFASRKTLGEVAQARLDDWHKLAVGNLAPEIKGVDIHGKPLMLSDYRGKVVAIVFWGTWCGPCMREIPREKALVERMKGRPFAMLGVDTETDADAARKVIESQGITWPNWQDGEPGEGPIAKLYHVQGYPTVYVIDADGKIRSRRSHGNELDQLIEKLVTERETASQ